MLNPILNADQAAILKEERRTIQELLTLLASWEAEPKALETLKQALEQLDELFMLVIVGEFNAGKSALINALLGERYLTEGVTPTTAQIHILRHGERAEPLVERGILVLHYPADFLREISIVDTPGTNVDDYIPSVLEGCKREGKLYGFPKAINGSAFIINKSMFDEKGVALPPDDADWTYADFEEAAAAMTDEEAKIFGCEVTTGHAWIPTFLFTLGGRYLDPDEHRYAEGWLNSEANAEWVNWIKKLTDSGLKPSPGGLDAFGGMTGGMLGGNIAITHTDGFQQVAQAVREDTPYEWSGARTPIPAADVELKPHIALHGVMVPQGVKDVLKAVELAGYVTYGATTDMDRPSKMSTRKDFAEKQALTDYPHFRALYDQVFANNVQLHEGALITHVDILGEEWNQMIERVLLDGMDTMESLNVAAENYDKRVAEKEA